MRKNEMWQGRMWRGMARCDMERSDARVVTNEAVVSGDKQQPSGGSGGETSDKVINSRRSQREKVNPVAKCGRRGGHHPGMAKSSPHDDLS